MVDATSDTSSVIAEIERLKLASERAAQQFQAVQARIVELERAVKEEHGRRGSNSDCKGE